MRKLNRFMEHFWLAVAIGTLIWAVWVTAAEGLEAGKRLYFFPFIAVAMFLFRRITRRKLEAMEDRS